MRRLGAAVVVGVCARATLPADWAAVKRWSTLCDMNVFICRGHLVYKLAAQAVCVVHWFNPAAWLLRRMMSEACELAVTVRWRGCWTARSARNIALMPRAAADVRAAGLASALVSPAGCCAAGWKASAGAAEAHGAAIYGCGAVHGGGCFMAGLTACAADEAAGE